MGWLGLVSIFGGLGILEMNSVEGNKEIASTVAVSGLIVGWAGAGVAALGTSREHRALVKMGSAREGCLGCLLAWGTAWNPLFALASYPISAAQRRADAGIYDATMGQGEDTVSFQISPMATPSGLGFGLNGSF
jgi:hypothetical protein